MNRVELQKTLSMIVKDANAISNGGDWREIVLETLIDNMRAVLPHLEAELDTIARQADHEA